MAYGDYYKRVIVPVRQRPISADLNRLQDQTYETVRAAANALYRTPVTVLTSGNADNRYQANPAYGFTGPSFWVTPNPASTPFGLLIYPGHGYSPYNPANVSNYDSANELDYTTNDSWSPLVLSDFESGFTVPAPPAAGSCRIDRIEVKASYLANNPQTVGIFNTATEVFDPATRNKDFTWDALGRTGSVTAPAASTAVLSYKQGVAAVGAISAATPAPATAGYVTIALINVVGGSVAIAQKDIVDYRRPILPSGVLRVAGRAIIPGLAAGLGLEDFSYQDMPPGIFVKMAFQSNTPPSAGTSYTAHFYVIGGDLFPVSNAQFGSLVATSMKTVTRTCYVGATQTSLGTSDIAILDGSDANWTVVNGVHDFAYGQPCCILSVTIQHPAGSALTNEEPFCFQYSLSLA